MGDFGFDPSLVPSSKTVQDSVTSEVQGIFSIAPTGKYATGARTIIRINGKVAAFAFSVSWDVNTAQDEIWTIDDWTPYELAPKRISVEGTIGGFHIPGKGPTPLLISPNSLSFLFHKYITIEIRDRTTDMLLFKTEKAVVTSRHETLQAEQMGLLTLQWKAIGWADEQSPEWPKGADDGKSMTGRPDSSGGPATQAIKTVSGFLSK